MADDYVMESPYWPSRVPSKGELSNDQTESPFTPAPLEVIARRLALGLPDVERMLESARRNRYVDPELMRKRFTARLPEAV